VLALRPDLGGDVAGVEEGGREEVGDHAGVVQGGIFAAGIGGVEVFEDIGPGGDGLADGGPERRISFPQARGVGGLVGDVEGHHDRGQAGAEGDLRRPRVGADVEPGGGGDDPNLETGPAHQDDPGHACHDVGGALEGCGDVGQGPGAKGDGDPLGDPRGAGPVAARAGRPAAGRMRARGSARVTCRA